jgi:malonyl-CoA/methylmalonyl-CoA synthetase
MNLYGLFSSRFNAAPDSVCLELEDGTALTYRDLEAETARFANLLTSLGLKKGDRVAAQIDKRAETVFLYLGCLRAGLVYLPLNTAYQAGEIAYFAADAEPKAAFCRPEAQSWFKGVPNLPRLEDAPRHPATFSTVDSAPDDLACIVYTSGTTGQPKGAMVTHRNLATNAQALHECWRFRPGDVLLHTLPMFHVHGLFVALHTALLNASRMIYHARFDAAAALAALPRASVFMGVPTYYVRLLGEKALTRELCQRMRLFVSGSAPLAVETFEEFERRTGHAILERYGMTETGMNTSNPFEGERRRGTVGMPLQGIEVRVVDDADAALATGDTGHIQVRGPNVMSGYWKLPEKNSEEFTADGYFRTGDLGRYDADGYLSIVGRAKDMVISGGYNVYPREIELLLESLPGVRDCAVFGVPHADFGEAVNVAIVLAPGATLTESQVIAHVKSQLANFKVPKRVVFLPELPRNAMGKVLKNVLRATYSPT